MIIRNGKSIYRCEIEEMNFRMDHIGGPATEINPIYWVRALVQIDATCEGVNALRDSFLYERKSKFIIKSHYGMSGCEDRYIRYEWNPEFHLWRNTPSVHISMNGKLNDGVNCFLPDILEMFAPDEIWESFEQWIYTHDSRFHEVEPEIHEEASYGRRALCELSYSKRKKDSAIKSFEKWDISDPEERKIAMNCMKNAPEWEWISHHHGLYRAICKDERALKLFQELDWVSYSVPTSCYECWTINDIVRMVYPDYIPGLGIGDYPDYTYKVDGVEFYD